MNSGTRKTKSVKELPTEGRKDGIELQDNIRWWTKDFRGVFDHDLYIRVIKAKMQST